MAGITVRDAGGACVQLVEVGGTRVCNMNRNPDDEAELVRGIKNLPCRDDDVFLLTPVKSGTHWVWEIASMLMASQAVTIPKSKSSMMLEDVSASDLDLKPSPRILNSHLDIDHLPQQLFEKRLKIVHVIRNPKDMAVSYYNHVTGIRCYGYDGKWEDFLDLFLNNELDYGSWFRYVKEWEEFIKKDPSYPFHVIYYEDLHKNNIHEIKRLGEFLGKPPSDQLALEISHKCSFKNMYVAKMYPDDERKRIFNGDFTMYRKGQVGDWKNWFTVRQNEQFDELYRREMSDSSLTFQYS